MKEGKYKCIECGERNSKRKEVEKKRDGWYCKKCAKEKKKNHREFLKRDVCKIKKRSNMIKEEERRKLIIVPQKKKRRVSIEMPDIKRKIISKQIHLYLTRDEKNVLYRKFVANGMLSIDASDRVKVISEKMNKLAKKIRKEAKEKELTEEQMNQKFLEGLSKYSEVE